MAMVVKNNMAAVSTLNTLNRNSGALQKSLAKVSSGMKINSAQDDASGYAISERMRVQIRALDQANQNTQNGSSMMKTAEGAVASTIEILKTLKEKAINAATDTNTDADRQTIQKEVNQFIDQIDDNALVTFNGKYLVEGSKTQAGKATYTAFTNQSLATDVDGDSKLTALNNRKGESLEIVTSDYVTASFVKDGHTYSTNYQVGESKLADVFVNLNAQYVADSGAAYPAFGAPNTTASTGTAVASDTSINVTGSGGAADTISGLLSGTNADETYQALEAIANGDTVTTSGATVDLQSMSSDDLDKLKQALAIMATYTTEGTEVGDGDDSAAAAALATETENLSTNLSTNLAGATNFKLASVADTGIVTTGTAVTIDEEDEATKLATQITAITTAVDKAIDLQIAGTEVTDDDSTTAANVSEATNLVATMTQAKGGDFMGTSYATLAAKSAFEAADDSNETTLTTYTQAYLINAAAEKFKTSDEYAEALEAAKTTFAASESGGTEETESGTMVAVSGLADSTSTSGWEETPASDTLVLAKTPNIGLSASGDMVKTADGTEGLTVTANESGLSGQISGLTISISNSEGQVKKTTNEFLNAFSTTIFAANDSVDYSLKLHVGAQANQSISVGLQDMRAEALGLKGSDGTVIDLTTQERANAAVAAFDNAIAKALDQQTTIGAVEARLEYTSSNLTTSAENTQAAESAIRDADMAKEMTNYTKNNVLLQAAQSMLAQANQNASAVLSLLQ